MFRFKLGETPRDPRSTNFVKRNRGFVQKRLRPGCYQLQGCYSTIAAQATGFPAERMCLRLQIYLEVYTASKETGIVITATVL